ncbi:aminopeptidase P family protein [Corynebacterium epidermidicanis]|uniref:Xaa-Pro aminopeptidase n=1 Tax=Corynebacterium epidermidicanis TaxID=1050174 RepID=A0A0G3GRQ9_9CORY|nr:aminopeptidase P family protein [Corynebacterium epidermidicanis]AKK03245.1 Xaa-Pro aminopeptidase [Corynebacterium epidermidicanis]
MTSFADTRFSNRRRALASAIAAQRLDAILVTHLTHVRYLSNFSGSNAALLVNKDLTARICTDGRYTTQIATEVPDIEALIERNSAVALLGTVQGPRRVGFEADYLSVTQLEKLQAAAPEDVQLVPVSGVIEKLRLVKDNLSQQRLRDVAALATTALDDLLTAGELAVGRREIDVAADLEYRMRKLGAERPSFDTIVASGPNSAKPHHGASDRVITAGDLVTIDFGAHDRGFNSDMTRTFVMGHADEFAAEIYQVVLEAQLAGVAAATPGTQLVDVDKACRDIIEAAGYGEYFVHSTGHGLGLDVHEAPYAAQTGTGVLAAGMTLTIEPGIYVPGRGGVRIEDSLLITDGAPEIITIMSKELTIV